MILIIDWVSQENSTLLLVLYWKKKIYILIELLNVESSVKSALRLSEWNTLYTEVLKKVNVIFDSQF